MDKPSSRKGQENETEERPTTSISIVLLHAQHPHHFGGVSKGRARPKVGRVFCFRLQRRIKGCPVGEHCSLFFPSPFLASSIPREKRTGMDGPLSSHPAHPDPSSAGIAAVIGAQAGLFAESGPPISWGTRCRSWCERVCCTAASNPRLSKVTYCPLRTRQAVRVYFTGFCHGIFACSDTGLFLRSNPGPACFTTEYSVPCPGILPNS